MLFGGTEEGRKIAGYLSERNISALVCVATEYGAGILPGNINVLQGRLDEGEMSLLMEKHNFLLCIDATHPYAVDVSRNISAACKKSGLNRVRIIRKSIETDGCIYFDTPAEIAEYLSDKPGNVFVTTGSKELAEFVQISERAFVRVLPNAEVVKFCNETGFSGKHLICMQGPFSAELNAAMLRETNSKFLVTKESGAAGGFEEKIEAAKSVGAVPLVLRRPMEETGVTIDEIFKIIEELV